MGRVIPFRSRARRDTIRKAAETRARRKELAQLSRQPPPLHLYSALELERIYWDVDGWIAVLSQDHPNLPYARCLEQHISSEYQRRRQDDPREAANKHIARVLDEVFGRYRP